MGSPAMRERTSWFDELRQASPDVLDVAAALGLNVARRRFGPCPACGKGDPRHEAITPRHGGAGWLCAHCKASGDAARLGAWVVAGCASPGADGWNRVRAVFAAHGWCSGEGAEAATWTAPARRAPAPEAPYADPDELRAFLRACRRLDDVPAVRAWADRRGFGPRTHAAVVPDVYPWPKWWPFRGKPWRCIVSAVDPAGVVRNVHGRNTEGTDDTDGRTRWAAGVRATGLFFADPIVARPMLTGKGEAKAVVVVEGITDYIALGSRAPAGMAVLGATSGGFAALAQARITPGVVVYAGTDKDPAGDRYANEIYTAFRGTGRDVRRIDWKASLTNGAGR